MHKRNLNINIDSIRIARAAQVRLDEISDKIDREKHRRIKVNHREKIKIWNELKSIHRVFEPLYVIKENQEKLGRGQSASLNIETLQTVGNRSSDDSRGKGIEAGVFVKPPRLLNRTISSSETLHARRRHSDPNVQPLGGRLAVAQSSTSGGNLQNHAFMRPRSQSWSPSSSSKSQRSRSAPMTSEREHLAKRRSVVEVPHVSKSMSSVTMGYLAFKRVLNKKRQSVCMDCKVVDSRFRSMSMDDAELSAKSRLVMPEQADTTDVKEDGLPVMASTQTNPHLVKKDNKQRPGLNRRSSTCTSMYWPLGELPMRSPETRRNSLQTPDLLRTKSTDVPHPSAKMFAQETSKTERAKRSKTPRRHFQERSSESDAEDNFGTFDENLCLKIKHTRLKKELNRGSKLLRPF